MPLSPNHECPPDTELRRAVVLWRSDHHGFVELTVNHVISKRFVKKQQMKWSPSGAHLSLEMRTRVLNDEL